MSEIKLTPKQEAFCLALVKSETASQSDAYRQAYNASKMTSKTVNERASVLMADSKITARVAELRAAAAKGAVIDASYVLKRLVEIDQMDVLDIHNDDGTIKPIKEWPKVWRQFLSSVEVSEIITSKGDDEKVTAVLKKVKWPDKVKNLELLGKHLSVGAFVERVDHTSSDRSMTPASVSPGLVSSLLSKLVD